MAGETLHEDRSILTPDVLDRHRALSTIMEELEAIDWYDQRIQGAGNAELARILANNRDEEKEHASMLLEWLRRHDPGFDHHLRVQLFNEGAIRETDEIETEPAASSDGSLGIGSLRVG
jgi:ferritin-like protein